MIIALAQVTAKGLAQKITLNTKNTPIEKVLQTIRAQSGYGIIYNARDVKDEKVTLSLKNASVEEAMEKVLEGLPFTFELVENNVILKPKEPSFLEKLVDAFTHADDVRGRILDESGKPLEGATIVIKGTDITTKTNIKGDFVIPNVDEDAVLVIRYVGYKQLEIPVKGAVMPLEIKLNQVTGELQEVSIKGSTGYQVLSKNHPGSFDVIDNKLLNRTIGPDILSRIENLTTGVSFNNVNDGLLIRGRNSIFSNITPLIVLDNFPYDGDINNINPNDVESVTILKDAAAASIWGARAGNGVIVITTKKGTALNPTIQVNLNTTFQQKPDLNSVPTISSSDAIDVEKWLFEKGYYDGDIDNIYTWPILSPVQELLLKIRNNEIGESDGLAQIEALKKIDVREDLNKYFYKTGLSQQAQINFNGVSKNLNYYLSTGWDKSKPNYSGTSSNRFRVRSQNTYNINKSISIDLGVNFTQSIYKGGNSPKNIGPSGGKALYPYADLVDDSGFAKILTRTRRSSYVDTAGAGQLLDWRYRPYDEIDAIEGSNNSKEIVLNLGTSYKILPGLTAELKYQYQNTVNTGETIFKIESFYTRDLINSYYQPNAVNKFPVPKGGILSYGTSLIKSHQGRAQLSYNKSFDNIHSVNAIAGWELKDIITQGRSFTSYGYNGDYEIANTNMDFVTEFPMYYFPSNASQISNQQSFSTTSERFISSYVNSTYRFKELVTISASLRQDATNLFGVKTNQKGVPLWSAGVAWEISNHEFLKNDFVPFLKVRLTYGSNGNYSRNVSAYTTANYGINQLGLRIATISSAPNEDLRWEKVKTLNTGLDFGFKNGRINGSIEYYKKNISDLMGRAPIDPTTGLSPNFGLATFFGNTANMKGDGFELQLNSLNTVGKFKWESNLTYSYTLNKVTKYLVPAPADSYSLIGSNTSLTPIVGMPLHTFYSLKWAGLESTTGDPLGYIGTTKSKDYESILNKATLDSLIYHGVAQPPHFGALRNTLTWNRLSFSFNISYKLGYYFRRNSVSYTGLFSSWSGHGDFSKRWQKPGDEISTNIPSMVYADYPSFYERETFYQMSEALVQRGDHIRLEDLTLRYTLSKNQWRNNPFQSITIGMYVSNLNVLLWKADKDGVDPYYNGSEVPGKRFAFSFNFTL